jgi:SAM-dependent methyltransferase
MNEQRHERRHAPAAERNRGPILDVLARVLPARGTVLEMASGTGQHVAHFAAALPGLVWLPSESDSQLHTSIAAWTAGLSNVRPPIALDATAAGWPVAALDAVYAANLVHITPWEVCLGLLAGAGRHLVPGGLLVLYGPYRIDGEHTAPSNAAFDQQLRRSDPRWGVGDLEAVRDAGKPHGLRLEERVAMPANNQTLIFRRA